MRKTEYYVQGYRRDNGQLIGHSGIFVSLAKVAAFVRLLLCEGCTSIDVRVYDEKGNRDA